MSERLFTVYTQHIGQALSLQDENTKYTQLIVVGLFFIIANSAAARPYGQ
jgi:hypothetical protein